MINKPLIINSKFTKMEKETNYVAPVVEVIEVEVEKGFQASEVPGAGEDPF